MKKKIIGVCLTKIGDRTRAEYIRQLSLFAAKKGFKLIIYNSVDDFFNNDSYDAGARTVYDYINFDLLDGLIILPRHFYDSSIVDNIISAAKEHGIPTIVIGEEREGCYSVVEDYTEAYKAVIRHVIKDHGARDTFFIAGLRENDPDSVKRIQCYKEVLEENGLEFSDNLVDYGEYWRNPTVKVVNRLLARQKLPQAIICANDYMALAVIEVLDENDIRVPDDVIVTGFDGVPNADYFKPRLTTCKEDISALAEHSISIMNEAFNGSSPSVSRYSYAPRIGESCGCKLDSSTTTRDVSELFYRKQELETHEDFMLSCLDRICEKVTFSDLYTALSATLLNNSWIGLNSEFSKSISGANDIAEDELYIIPSKNNRSLPRKINKSSLIPNFEEWMRDETAYLITAAYMGSHPCGIYAVRTVNITDCTNKINLVSKVVNIGFSSFFSFVTQLNLKKSIDSALTHNQVTKLPNIRGANEWFENFAADFDSHTMPLTVSIYSMPQYKYIYENYGVKDVEETSRLVADALVRVNSHNSFVAQIADDEFVVINYYSDGSEIGDTINRATSEFFKIIEDYNSSNGKEYFVEVNCGCAVVNSGWKGTLASFTKFATAEMYANRLSSGMGAAVKKESSAKDYYHAFNALLDKNLFLYHFQPIVSAKNGEIIAYEALMRTDASIGMNPMQVLETAKAYNRLYDIERATMFNVMERYHRDIADFHGRKVFINSIPGHFLKENDLRVVVDKYSQYIDSFVFEITEQDTATEGELEKIREFGSGLGNQIAIDDYGTGHSNIVNLLRYTPQIIKIDRFLITDIHTDLNKQMFVKSTIEFARLNNIKVLAEGVETADELKTVIGFGVDYIQGYYTGKPQYEPIDHIADEVRSEIIAANQ